MTRVQRAAWWTAPSLLCLALYWYGLKAWFAQDDFAWLSLHFDIRTLNDFWRNMFAPMAQGTLRFLSERGFFLLFYWLFGMDALPFRIFVFATQFADLALLASIMWRLTGSRLAGFAAPVLWLVNSSLVTPMSWSSCYNQILCCFFLLLSFWLFLRHIETGRWCYYVWQWVAFLLGFGALELNVMYPALAFSYTFFCARRHVWKTLPLFVVSGLYTLLHNYVAPTAASGVYAMHWDRSILQTLRTYTEWAMGSARLDVIGFSRMGLAVGAAWLLIGSLALFAAWKIYRGEYLALFFVSWYALILGPLLPLRDHMSTYYLTIPTVGLAMLAGWGLAEAMRSRMALRLISAVLVAVYLTASIPLSRAETRWHYNRSHAVRDLVRGVERARQLHPAEAILVTGVSSEVFWASFPDHAFRSIGIENVFIAPSTGSQQIDEHPELGDIAEFFLPGAIALRALERGEAVVYDASGGPLRNITTMYGKMLESANVTEPRFVDAGNPLFRNQLGPGWYSTDGFIRWMGLRAAVRLGGPSGQGQSVHLVGHAPQELFQNGTLRLSIHIDDQETANFRLGPDNVDFDLAAPLPSSLRGRNLISLVLEVDHTYTPPADGRPLSLAFGKIFIR